MEQMFFNRFSTKEKVIENFKPANWWKFLGNEESCVKAPTVTLCRIDSLYNSPGLAVTLIKEQIMGIYTMSAPNGSAPNMQAMEMAASMFTASNKGCGIYEAELYFAGYQGKYKSKRSYMAFDTGDILSAFGANFLPYWQQLQGKYDTNTQQEQLQRTTGEITGKAALQLYISRTVEELGDGEKGIEAFMQKSAMARLGYITRQNIEEAVQQANQAF